MFCPSCGNPVTSGGRFCFNCGASLPVTQTTSGGASNGRDEETAERKAARPDGVDDPLVGRLIENKYRLEERIGVGGMGTVYRATRLLIGDIVAIKILHADFVRDTEAERFRREAQAAARLKHPNAVNIYDFGVTDDGTVYLVMELVEGESLRQIIKAQGTLKPDVAGQIVQQVCAALDEAHHRHVIHRDIKPDNIIVHTTRKGIHVKVLDFGVAKLRDAPVNTLTQTGSVVGTPHYMSPEQCLGEELDQRSDIYSVGIVLYEMLCGTVPFNLPVSTAVIVQHVNQPPPPLRAKNNLITPLVERVVLHALEKKREARPQTAGALAEEVAAALEGRALSREFTHDAVREMATVSSAGLRGTFEDDEQTAARDVSVAAQLSGAQLAATEVLRTPPAMSGAANPVGVFSGNSGVVAGSRASFVRISALAAALIVVIALAGLVMWMSGDAGQQGKAAESGQDSGKKAKDETTASPERQTANAESGKKRNERSATSIASHGEMAYVQGGVFSMGNSDGDEYERPIHKVSVRPFFMDKYEVTCEEYARFLQDTNYTPLPAGWTSRSCPLEVARLPVAGVTWDDANAYARWADKRLPTEEEWEFAARGTDGRRYPWGDYWRAGLANADAEGALRKRVAAVGQFNGASPYGIVDLSGNVWEWTASPLLSYSGGPIAGVGQGDFRVIRGGSWDSSKKYVTTSYRGYLARNQTKPTIGFRCVRDAPP